MSRMRFDLAGRRALVTGAASGIGLATVTLLARSGARVALNHLPYDERGVTAIAALRAAGLDVIAAPGKVGAAGETERMVADAVTALGGLDLLANNAGTPGRTETVPIGRLDLVTDDLWETVLETNLLGTFRCSKAAAAALRESRGAIVNTASIAGVNGSIGSSMAYAASKGGVINLTRGLARHLAPEVRVNAVAPGAVDSTWINWTPEQRRLQVERSALKRIGTPDDYAGVIVYLGFGSDMITGQTLVVDAGMTL